MRGALVLLALPCALGKGLVPSLASQLKSRGDAVVATVACCGCGAGAGLPVLSEALGATPKPVAFVSGPTDVALAAVDEPSEGGAAVAASDVIVLEVSFADLVRRSSHGLSQLFPLLQRAARLRGVRPQKKLLLLAVTGYDPAEASEADVAAFAAAELDALVAQLATAGEEEAAPLATADLLQLSCLFVPHRAYDPAGYASALDRLQAAFTAAGDKGYLFADGKWAAPASAAAGALEAVSAAAPPPKQEASPAEVHTAYLCGLLAEAASREFAKGATALKKAADTTLLPDFGEQASELLNTALGRFDSDASELQGAAPVAAARDALEEQLRRALYAPYRKQLAALQRQTLTRFRQKVAALKPSSEIDAQLKALVKEFSASFDTSAKTLLPPGVRWSYSYEKHAVVESIEESAALHLQTLQVQGLYLPTEGVKLPLDMSVHWLGLHPFGRDSRYDPIGRDDSPAYKPQAAPMRLSASSGYRPRTKVTDPKRMIFTDKMVQ